MYLKLQYNEKKCMNHRHLSHPLYIYLLIFLLFSLFSIEINAQDKNNNNVGIDVEVSKVNNIISNSNGSVAKIIVGSVKQSSSVGRVIVNVNTKKLENRISNGSKNVSLINVGGIENSELKNVDVNLELDSVTNSIKSGTRNRAITNVGAIKNTNINGKVVIDIKSRSDITNTIRSGSRNISEISVGSITDDSNERDTVVSLDQSYFTPETLPQQILIVSNPDVTSVQNITKIKTNAQVSSKTTSPGAATNHNRYTIEKRQSSIGSVGGHNFLVLRNPKGNVMSEMHGLPVNLKTGSSSKKNSGGKRGLRVFEFDRSKGENSDRIKKNQPTALLFSANKKQTMAKWKISQEKRKEINKLKLPYPKLGVKLFRRTVNSNSVESTLSAAMGLKSPKLKLPLTIQEKEQAIEYDIEPEQSFLLTPGEGRLIRP